MAKIGRGVYWQPRSAASMGACHDQASPQKAPFSTATSRQLVTIYEHRTVASGGPCDLDRRTILPTEMIARSMRLVVHRTPVALTLLGMLMIALLAAAALF